MMVSRRLSFSLFFNSSEHFQVSLSQKYRPIKTTIFSLSLISLCSLQKLNRLEYRPIYTYSNVLNLYRRKYVLNSYTNIFWPIYSLVLCTYRLGYITFLCGYVCVSVRVLCHDVFWIWLNNAFNCIGLYDTDQGNNKNNKNLVHPK